MINRSRLALSIGLLLEILLLYLLFRGIYKPYFVIIWILGLIVIFFYFYKNFIVKLPSLIFLDFIGLFLIIALLFTVNLSDLTHWYYSAINDEYAFFDLAKSIAEGDTVNIFNHRGVYQIIPVMSSFYQGTMMKLLGINNWGWKASIIILIGISLVPFYFLVKQKFGQIAAYGALVIFAFSHYLWAYLHTGYSNVEPIALTIFSFYFFMRGLEEKKAQDFFLAGIFAGLGFYTFFSSRDAVVILVLFLFLSYTAVQTRIKGILTSFLLGFFPTFLPIAVVAKKELITKMLERSITNAYGTDLKGVELIANNLYRSLFGFFIPGNFGPYTVGPHIYGSLLDTLSGALFVLGVCIGILHLRKLEYRFLFLWFSVSLFTVGVMSQYAWTNVSRLYYLLPPIAIFGGIALEKLTYYVEKLTQKKWIAYAFFALFSLSILSFNLYRFYIETPKKKPMTQEALAVRELRIGDCSKFNMSQVALIDENGEQSTVIRAMKSYPLPTPHHFSLETLTNLYKDINRFKCAIIVHPQNEVAQNALSTLLMQKNFLRFTKYDLSKTSSIEVLKRQ